MANKYCIVNIVLYCLREVWSFNNVKAHRQRVFELYLHLPVVFVLFQVFCTAPKRYMVVDSDGVIKPRCCIDMYVTILY